MASELEKNRKHFIRNFKKQKFCSLEKAKALRQMDDVFIRWQEKFD